MWPFKPKPSETRNPKRDELEKETQAAQAQAAAVGSEEERARPQPPEPGGSSDGGGPQEDSAALEAFSRFINAGGATYSHSNSFLYEDECST